MQSTRYAFSMYRGYSGCTEYKYTVSTIVQSFDKVCHWDLLINLEHLSIPQHPRLRCLCPLRSRFTLSPRHCPGRLREHHSRSRIPLQCTAKVHRFLLFMNSAQRLRTMALRWEMTRTVPVYRSGTHRGESGRSRQCHRFGRGGAIWNLGAVGIGGGQVGSGAAGRGAHAAEAGEVGPIMPVVVRVVQRVVAGDVVEGGQRLRHFMLRIQRHLLVDATHGR